MAMDNERSIEKEQLPGIGNVPHEMGEQDDSSTLQAWLQVLGSFFLVFNTWGTITAFGDFQAFYERGTLFQQTTSNIAWIGSVQTLLVFITGIIVGPIYDRGLLKALILLGAFGIVFGHMMLSLCGEYWQIVLAQGFVIGLGGGCLFVPSLAVVQPYFQKKNLGLAMGIVASGSSLGGIIYPVVFINLIDSMGFAWTVRVMGFVALATLLIPLRVSMMKSKPNGVRRMVDWTAFTDAPFLLGVLGCFLGYAGCQVAFFYTAFFGQDNGWVTGSLALYLLPIINGTAAVGRILPNWIADFTGPVDVVLVGSALLLVILASNIAVSSAAGVITVAVFFGLVSGVFIATPPLVFIALTKDKSVLGSRMGTAYALLGLSILPGGPGAGAVLQHGSERMDWRAAWIYAAAFEAASLLVFVGLRMWTSGFKLRAKA